MTIIQFPPLVKATFLKKINRFLAMVELNGDVLQVHIPSTGRLDGVLKEGYLCYLKPANNPKRKTAYSLFIVEANQVHVCIDALVANQFAYQLLKDGKIKEINGGTILKEVAIERDRFDFVVQHQQFFDFIEVKSVNKSDDGIACFPDAPTERGRKHIKHLIRHQQDQDKQSHLLFIVQRNDAKLFTACSDRDPEFATVLKEASKKGVKIHVALTKITENDISFEKWLPIKL